MYLTLPLLWLNVRDFQAIDYSSASHVYFRYEIEKMRNVLEKEESALPVLNPNKSFWELCVGDSICMNKESFVCARVFDPLTK